MAKDKKKNKVLPSLESKIDVNLWSKFHRRWDKIVTGEVPRPNCPKDDNHLMVPGIGEDDSPILRCLVCNTKMIIGSNFYEGE